MGPALVLAGGQAPPVEWVRPKLERAPWIFCADSGLRICLQCDMLPHALIGDLDSLEASELEELPELKVGVFRHSVHKDESDLQLTLQRLAQHWQGPVEILGALGGRLDHTLFNLCSMLYFALNLGLDARVVDPDTVVMPVNAKLVLDGFVGYHCSLLPLTDQIEEVHLQGFRFGLNGESLSRYETRGLSNVVEHDRAIIEVGGGQGLVMLTRP